jgi:hypothetical protein
MCDGVTSERQTADDAPASFGKVLSNSLCDLFTVFGRLPRPDEGDASERVGCQGAANEDQKRIVLRGGQQRRVVFVQRREYPRTRPQGGGRTRLVPRPLRAPSTTRRSRSGRAPAPGPGPPTAAVSFAQSSARRRSFEAWRARCRAASRAPVRDPSQQKSRSWIANCLCYRDARNRAHVAGSDVARPRRIR